MTWRSRPSFSRLHSCSSSRPTMPGPGAGATSTGPPARQAVKTYPVRVTGTDIEIEG